MAAKKHADLSEEVEPIAAHTKLKLLGLPSNPLSPISIDQRIPQDLRKFQTPSLQEGWKSLVPFSQCIMNAPSLRAQYLFDDDDQEQPRVPITWVDIFEGRAEENNEDARPWLKSTQRSKKKEVED